MVFYRKYRPQTIDELDSESVRKTLTSLVSAKSLPHAFLFTGPKGLGKTSAARILAKIVNCEKRKKGSIEPCNRCKSCLTITNGSNLDILEIDAASNRGIDEIRDLREKIKLVPFSAFMKVYIVDEVHMLTTEAFNALLKTLEEPPTHAMFILATTEAQKLPETIVSRCFHIPFQKANETELTRSFKRIVKAEKIKIDKDGLLKIAQLSDGSFRDGAKLLEELVAHAGRKQITEKLFEEIYKSSSQRQQAVKLFSLLAKRDGRGGVSLLDALVTENVNVKAFADELLRVLHETLLQKIGVKHMEGQEIEIALTIDELKKLATIFSQRALEIKYAVIPQLPLELGIIEWCSDHRGDGAEVELAGPAARSSQRARASLAVKDGANALRSTGSPPLASPSKIDPPGEDILEALIKRVKPYNHSVAGVLRGCQLRSFDGKKLVIEAAYKFHKDRLDEVKTQELIEKVCQEITGVPVTISVLLKGGLPLRSSAKGGDIKK